MNGPLDDIDRRINWAWQHIEKLDADVKRVLASPLYNVSVEPQSDGLTYLYRVHVLRDIPDDFGVRVADCIHNLRATLDNIVYALVSGYRKPPWGLAFPICRNPSQWKAKALPMFEGVPQGAIDIIERQQPYKSADRKAHWVKVLNDRWNRDKHRTPMVVGAIPTRGSFLAAENVCGYEIFVGKPLEEGMPVARVVYCSRDHTARDPHFEFEVAIDEGHARTLTRAIPGFLVAGHYLVRDEVLKGLRPYIREPV